MPNTIEFAVVLQSALDDRAAVGLTSGWMDANAGNVIYNGGKYIKIPSLSTDGLKDYDKTKGYPDGAVTLSYEQMEMTMDRGTSFTLDAMDVNESNFVATATNVTSRFQAERVLPEIDAYRYSKLYAIAKAAGKHAVYTADAGTVWDALMDDIAKIVDIVGETTPLMISIASPVKSLLEKTKAFKDTSGSADFKAGAVSTKLKTINDHYLSPVPSARMKTAYVFADGKTDGQTTGGFTPGTTAAKINWIICPSRVPIAVTKQDNMKIFDPKTYQKADAWYIGYRRYHDLWVAKNQVDKMWVNAEQEGAAG